jgi:hypothetical protein
MHIIIKKQKGEIMNNKKYIRALKTITYLSILLTTGLSFILHFAYELSNYNQLVALFVPVNESVWEHIKLLFFPMFVLLFIVYFFLCLPKKSPYSQKTGKTCSNTYVNSYLFGMAMGLLTGIFSIIVLFYTTYGIIGHSIDWLNIVIFIIANILSHLVFFRIASRPFANTYAYHVQKNHSNPNTNTGNNYTHVPAWISLVIITACITLFIVFTFYPPHIGLFCDSETHTYGPHVSSHPWKSLFKR